jgi:hypothetical protein
MSKKIWRGKECNAVHGGMAIIEDTLSDDDATVITDALCFPVKEAMAVCKAIEVWYNSPTSVHVMVNENKLANVTNKYIAAKERMKKKASKK